MSAKSRREKREAKERLMYAGIAGTVALAGGIGGAIVTAKKKSKKSDNLEDIKAGSEATEEAIETTEEE